MSIERKIEKMTDHEVEKLEARISKEYKRAADELEEKLKEYLEQYQDEVQELQLKYLYDKSISKQEYTKAMRRLLMDKRHWTDMRDKAAAEYANIASKSSGWLRDGMKGVYANGYNSTLNDYKGRVKHIADLNGVQLEGNFNLYSKEAVERLLVDHPQLLKMPGKVSIPEAKRWNAQRIESEVLQGILQGDSIPDMAARLRKVAGMDAAQAMRAARTAMNNAQNGGRQEASHEVKSELEQYGYTIRKQWQSADDDRTRPEHLAADGQTVDIDEPFIVGGEKLMYPCDMSGSGWNVYNCRCRRTDVLVKVGGKPREKQLDNSSQSGIIKAATERHSSEGDLARQSSSSLLKGIASFEQRIREHESKIASPSQYDENWGTKTEQQRQGLIRHWGEGNQELPKVD